MKKRGLLYLRILIVEPSVKLTSTVYWTGVVYVDVDRARWIRDTKNMLWSILESGFLPIILMQ